MMLAEAFVSGGLLNAALVHLRLGPQEFHEKSMDSAVKVTRSPGEIRDFG